MTAPRLTIIRTSFRSSSSDLLSQKKCQFLLNQETGWSVGLCCLWCWPVWPLHYSSVPALQLSPDCQQSPECKLGPSNTEQGGCLVSRGSLWSQISANVLDEHGMSNIRLMTPNLWVVLVKEPLLWLKLVFWWPWSPSHQSISAQSVRLIGGGGGLGKFLHNIPSSWSKTIWRSDLSLWFIIQLRASQVIIECHKMNF